jgi:hypothetical protein
VKLYSLLQNLTLGLRQVAKAVIQASNKCA